MSKRRIVRHWSLAWLAGLVAVFLFLPVTTGIGAGNASALNYFASCENVTSSSADGSVFNRSADTYQVNHTVTFRFQELGSALPKDISVTGSGIIAPGEVKVVAHAVLPFTLVAGTECHFIVDGAIKKVQK